MFQRLLPRNDLPSQLASGSTVGVVVTGGWTTGPGLLVTGGLLTTVPGGVLPPVVGGFVTTEPGGVVGFEITWPGWPGISVLLSSATSIVRSVVPTPPVPPPVP